MLVVDGARISVSRHSDSMVQKTVKGAQAQHIGKIVCVAGSEIDRQQRTMECLLFQEEGLDRKTNHQDLVKTETEEIFV